MHLHFLKKLNVACDAAIPLLVHPQENRGQGLEEPSVPPREAALFTAAKSGHNPAVHSGGTDTQNAVPPHNGLLLNFKEEDVLTPAATWMDMEDIVLN